MEKHAKLQLWFGKGFIWLSALSLLYVALMAVASPQAVMDLVGVELQSTDALSSIRGIYGGVGLCLVGLLLYFSFFETRKGLLFLFAFWGMYAASRLLTWMLDGKLGDFGMQWLQIESLFCLIALGIWWWGRGKEVQSTYQEA